jgi:class 3 adenylate cyclase
MPVPAMPDGPVPTSLLVAFYDLTRFRHAQEGRGDDEVFALMSWLAELAGDRVEAAGGRVIKFIGDAALIVFPEERADEGVHALVRLRAEADEGFVKAGWPCRMVVKVHFGPCVAGPIGTRGDKRFDIHGRTVSQAALLQSSGIALTPEAFRRLAPQTRKLLKRHTPPVRYIGLDEAHRG